MLEEGTDRFGGGGGLERRCHASWRLPGNHVGLKKWVTYKHAVIEGAVNEG